MLWVYQSGYDRLARGELEARLGGAPVGGEGPGWVLRAEEPGRPAPEALRSLAFPHQVLLEPAKVTGESVNALAAALLAWFLDSLRGETVSAPYSIWWEGPAEEVGLGRRIGAVQAAFEEALKKRMSRIARLAQPAAGPVLGPVRGIWVWFADFKTAYASRTGWRNGQRRMADDPLAPSRSYLKVEEAYGLLGREPAPGETVADLGAAPGGWSYSAAKRGAHVTAVDNGPLKAGAAAHPRIEHRREDAFRFSPPGAAFDWLFCDLVEEPHHVLSSLVRPWIERRWCRHFIVNVKFGRVDPLALLDTLSASLPPGTLIRHLYHDREEFTLVGSP